MSASPDSDGMVDAHVSGKNNHKSELFHGIEDEKTNKRKFTANRVKSRLYGESPKKAKTSEDRHPKVLSQSHLAIILPS